MKNAVKTKKPSAGEVWAWWDTMTLGEARKNFKKALADTRMSTDELAWTWVRYYGVANARGTTRVPAQCFPKLMDSHRKGEPRLIERLSHEKLPGLMLMAFRATVALAEFAEAPQGVIKEACDAVIQIARRVGVREEHFAFLRLAVAVRLGRAAEHEGDHLQALELWRDSETKNVRHLPECEAARAGIIIEWLITACRSEEALALAEEAAGSEPCISPCGLAPQTTLALILAPLLHLRCKHKARTVLSRLAAAAPVSRAWLLPIGCRLAALANLADFDKARALYEQAVGYADDPEISDWQRLHFHQGAGIFLRAAGDNVKAGAHEMKAAKIATALDARNGNSCLLTWLSQIDPL